MTHNPTVLPDNLPRPEDDGGADHLTGMRLPDLALRATSGEFVNLRTLARRTIVYAYPRTGVPNVPPPEGWNDIPGARGCTPQTLAFQNQREQISAFGADIFGLSAQTTEYQKELVDRLGLSFSILSDAEFKLTEALRLPTMIVHSMVLLKRLTLIIDSGRIEHVFYPVFPPNQAAADVIAWLGKNPVSDTFPVADACKVSGVMIYTTAQCPYCKATKELLRQRGVSFTEVDVDREPGAANAMVRRSGGRRTVPQIFFGQTHVGGADDLQALDKSGRLAALLSEQGR
jgi:GrxC family glutaredoxin